MRRPLFMVCLCLVIIMAVRMVLWEDARYSTTGMNTTSLLDVPDARQIIITGQVCLKDPKAFYIENVVLNSVIQQTDAAGQQQTVSISKKISEKLICEYAAEQEKAELYENTVKAVRLGSTVTVQGKLYSFAQATNPGEFDVKEYYASLGIVGKVKNVVLLEAGEEYSVWQETLFQVKEYFRKRLYSIFPEKEAGVMTAMLLGDKSGLDSELKRLYQENGIIHILCISGLHITIIGMSIYKLLRRLGVPVLPAATLGGVVLLLYGIITGLSVSSCRAIGMYLIHMLAEVAGRTYDMLTALGVMAAVMVCQNPAYLQNAGFYLSFGAVLGIGVLYPALAVEKVKDKVQRYEENVWKRRAIRLLQHLGEELRESALSGVAITLTTLPILLWFYYEVPVYSVFINLLILPFMNSVMLAGLFAMLVPGLGIVGTIDCVILSGYELLCQWFGRLPFHTWNPGRPQVWQMAAYYGMWLLVVFLGNMRRRRIEEQVNNDKKGKVRYFLSKRDAYYMVQIAALIVAVLFFRVKYQTETILTFLDVGQGDCICIQTASGQVYLFDCGSSSRSSVGEYVLEPFLKYSGIQHIDAVFVSHPDTDHCNGIEELLASGEEWGITVGQLVLPNTQNKEEDEKLLKLRNAAEQASQKEKIEIHYVDAGDTWQTEELQFLCLHPPADWESQDSNAYSECFYVEFADMDVELLLTGDVEGEGEELLLEELLERGIRGIDFLKVAHHGSRNSTSEKLLEQICPKLSIISCSEDNSYGHPHRETLERLENVESMVMATKDYGAITIKIGSEVEVYGFTK